MALDTVSDQGGDLSVSETYWGYEIGGREDRFDRERLAEPALKFLGLVAVLSAYGQWFLPARLFQPGDGAVVVKAVLCLCLGLLGAWLYRAGSRRAATGIEFDLTRREIRVVRRAGREGRRTEAAIPMARVVRAYVAPGRPASLCVELRAPEAVLQVATGSERELEALLARLAPELRPWRERIDEKLARSVGFRSRRA